MGRFVFLNLKVRRILTDSHGARTLSNTSLMAWVSWVLLSAGIPSRVSGMLYIIKTRVSFFILVNGDGTISAYSFPLLVLRFCLFLVLRFRFFDVLISSLVTVDCACTGELLYSASSGDKWISVLKPSLSLLISLGASSEWSLFEPVFVRRSIIREITSVSYFCMRLRS